MARKTPDARGRLLAIVAAVATLSLALPVIMAQAASGTVTGFVFDDLNSNGALDAADPVNDVVAEPGLDGVKVTAFDARGKKVGTATTGPDGNYTLSVSGASDQRVRVEFSGLPEGYGPTWNGPDSGTAVQFATLDATTKIKLGALRKDEYCQNAVKVAYACLRVGPSRDLKTLAMTPFHAATMTREDGAAETRLASALDIGAVWGLTVPRTIAGTGKFVYTSAFYRVGAQLGSGGTGAIYRTDAATGQSTLFADLNALFGADTAGTDPRGAGQDWTADKTWKLVGKAALGGLTSDEYHLYVVNLHDRQLYTIPIADPAQASRTPIPVRLPGAKRDCPHPDVRPFAAQHRGGKVYVGIVCSAESTKDDRRLRGYVYAYDVTTGKWGKAPELEFGIHRPREATITTSYQLSYADSQGWNPWSDKDPADLVKPGHEHVSHPMPWFTGLTFDGNDIVIGLRDIFADRWYLQSPQVIPGGDIIRACLAGSSWKLEDNGSCGGRTTSGAGNNEGNGGGEFYHADNSGRQHREVGHGAVWQVAGRSQLIASTFNPAFPQLGGLDSSGGFRFLSNLTGELFRAWTVYDFQLGNNFGKANGMGDVEALCDAVPLEIGNFVWRDADSDGIQDPGESPIAGVTVNLYDAQGAKVATQVTNAEGEYYFNDANVPGGLRRLAAYTIRLDNAADFATGGVLFNSVLSVALAGSNRAVDNDATLVDSFPTIVMQTGMSGQNDHTFDFGLNVAQNGASPTASPTPSGPPAVNPRIDIVKYDARDPSRFPADHVDGHDAHDNSFGGPTHGQWHPEVDADTALHAVEYDLAGATTGPQPVHFTVTNNGNRPLGDVRVGTATVSGPALQQVNCTFPNGSTGQTWSGPFAAGASFTCTSSLELNSDDVYHGFANVRGRVLDPGGSVTDVEVHDEDPYHARVDQDADQLAISKHDKQTTNQADTDATAVSFEPGESRVVEVWVNNVGPSDVKEVTVTDTTLAGTVKVTEFQCTFPDGTTADAVSQPDGSQRVKWDATFGDPPARLWAMSEPFTCTARLTMPAGAAAHLNRVTVDAKLQDGSPLSESDDLYARIGAIDIEKYDSSLGKPAGYQPALINAQVAKDADTAQFALMYQAGVPREILIAVMNTGTESLSNVVISDSLTGGVGQIQGLTCDFSPLGGPNSGLAWAGPLLPGAFFFCQGMLTLGANVTHASLAKVVGTGAVSGNEYSDTDPYHAKTAPIGGAPTSPSEKPPGGPGGPGGPGRPGGPGMAGGPLPTTGSSVMGVSAIGIGLVLAGLFLVRRFRDGRR